VRISLKNVRITGAEKEKTKYFYDFEFSLSIRGTGVYLHRREQDPCENAIRFERKGIPEEIYLHTGFLNSNLQLGEDGYSYFQLKFRVLEYRTEEGFIWDYKYPSRQIFSESLEIRVNDYNQRAGYRWLSDATWKDFQNSENGSFELSFRSGQAIDGVVKIIAEQHF